MEEPETRTRSGPKGSRCFVDEHYDDALVRQLGDTQAAQMVSFAEEPPGKMLVNAAEGPSSSASSRRAAVRVPQQQILLSISTTGTEPRQRWRCSMPKYLIPTVLSVDRRLLYLLGCWAP